MSTEAERAKTRARLLESAGQLFAEKGFDRTTSKEITERAGANCAAVNYYFGGIEGLYAAVLQESADLLLTSSEMRKVLAAHSKPEDKLREFLDQIVRTLTSPASSAWKLRILAREFSAPSISIQPEQVSDRLQKVIILKGVVAELMELPEDDPAVARGCICVLAPCFLLLTSDRPTLKLAFPKLGLEPDDAPTILDHLVRFSLAGLVAIKQSLT